MKKVLLCMCLCLGIILVGCKKEAEVTEQVMTYNIGENPISIDPLYVDNLNVVTQTFEGLYTESSSGKIVPGAAESLSVSKDGLVYTFKIRETAKWSDGKPLRAQDFEYAWKRIIDPSKQDKYAFQFFYIKNAQKYLEGKVAETDVGIKSINEKTLEVTLESPISYFKNLVTSVTYYPLRKDIVEGNGNWAKNPKTYIGNGPFKLQTWTLNTELVLEKNPNYWDSGSVKLDKLIFKMIPNKTESLKALKENKIDVTDVLPIEEIPALLADRTAKQFSGLSVNYLIINSIGENIENHQVKNFLRNLKVRKALSLAINRTQLVDEALKIGQKPATTFVPKGTTTTDDKEFWTKDYFPANGNVEQAKKLLNEAGYEDRSKIPTITLSYADERSDKIVVEALKESWKKELGINVELKLVAREKYWEDRRNYKYEIGTRWWSADYNDPMTFLEIFTSDTGISPTGFSNARYDEIISQAKIEEDSKKRTALLQEAEEILMDNMPIIPIYFDTTIVASNTKAKGWFVSPLNAIYFKNAYVDSSEKN